MNKYTKPLELEFGNFQNWKEEHKVMYCSDSKSGLRLFVALNGNITIEHNGNIVWTGIQPFPAIERFNELSHEYTNK